MRKTRRKTPKIDDSHFLIQRKKTRRRKNDPWFRSELHIDWIHTQHCAGPPGHICFGRIVAAHVRKGSDACLSEKPSDIFVLPLCDYGHQVQHSVGEITFWGDIDPIRRALEYAMNSDCERAVAAATAEFTRRYSSTREEK